jgi:NAD(P)-dependent dehydrogenase (short-subunit alcohol dehydrogenase family)
MFMGANMFRVALCLLCCCLLSSSAFADSQKTILVTGVTSELGWAIAQTLASEKYNLVLVGRNHEKLKQRTVQLTKTYPKNTFSEVVVDFSDLNSVQNIESIPKPIHGLVLIGPRPLFSTQPPSASDWDKVFKETFSVPRALLLSASNKIAPEGSVVIISGMTSKYYMPGYPNSNVVRLAWAGELKNLAHLLGPKKIRVNAISPAVILTSHHVNRLNRKAEANGQSYQETLAEATKLVPTGRYTEPSDLADVIAFLLSKKSKQLNAVDIPLDGGESRAY